MYEQTKLTYNYNGLEPVIDALTVETHYDKHHAAYTKNFNDAAKKAGVAEMNVEVNVEELLASLDKIGVRVPCTFTNELQESCNTCKGTRYTFSLPCLTVNL